MSYQNETEPKTGRSLYHTESTEFEPGVFTSVSSAPQWVYTLLSRFDFGLLLITFWAKCGEPRQRKSHSQPERPLLSQSASSFRVPSERPR